MWNPEGKSDMQVKLTEQLIKRRLPSKNRVELADTDVPGLRIRLFGKAAKWSYMGRVNGVRKRVTIGDWPDLTVVEARDRARATRQSMRDGIDVVEGKRDAVRVAKARRLLGDLHEDYTIQLGGSEKYQEDEARDVSLALEEMAVTDLPPNQLTAAHLRGLADLHKDHPATARHRFGATSRFLDWLVDEETLEINPAHMVSRRRRPGTPEARSRVLAAEEVRKIWKGCLQLPEPYGDLVRFMILVPLRRGEASKLTAEMIDGDRLILPHMITKNGDPFTIPLPQQAEEILTYRTAEGLLFASQRTGRPVQGWGTMLAKLHELSGTTGWSLHDFRRTFVSQLAEAAVPSDVTDALLNHRQAATRPGVIGVYNRSKLMGPKMTAMATCSSS